MTDQYQTREERRKQKQTPKRSGKNFKEKLSELKKKLLDIKNASLVKKILLAIASLMVLGFLFGTGLFVYYASTAPKLVEDQLKDPISSEIYDMNGELVTKIGVEKRDYVEYDDIPQLVIDAVLATEDNRFFDHPGVDLIRLGGAVLSNITDGYGSQGASTLTQQVIKNQFLTPEKTIKRKVQEAWLAFKLERKYTKKEIFEMYVNNVVDYDDGIHGIATASEYYYGKKLDELELYEAAMLAGIPQRPRAHNPFRNPEWAEKRRNTVLSLMYQHEKISKAQMDAAKKVSVVATLKKEEDRVKQEQKYDSFIDAVVAEVEAMGEFNAFTDGLKIYTTLDTNAQEHVEKVLNGQASVKFPDAEMQAGITLLDTNTGAIRAIGGNRNQEVKRGFNYALNTRRQPGSTIKPILDYGPAIEYLGWSTYEQLVDEKYTYSDGTPIHNWDQRYMGQMTMRKALYLSRNIPALKALQEVGLEQANEFATGLGFDFKNVYESYSIGGLGGEDAGVSPLQMAGAYAAFGNEGIYNKPYAVEKIVLRDGETEVKTKKVSRIAMKDSTAYMITDMLKDVLTKGSGSDARVPGVSAVAGKTGTTNYDKNTQRKHNLQDSDVPDSWFTGYTTKYTLAVWTGYKNLSDPIHHNHKKIPQYIFKDVMGYVSKSIKTADFKQPKSVVRAEVEIGSNPPLKPSEITPKNQIVRELFVSGSEPKEVSKKYQILEAPQNLKVDYGNGYDQITLSWDYADIEGVEFEVSEQKILGLKDVVYKGSAKEMKINKAFFKNDRTFEVVAVYKDRKSPAATVVVKGRPGNDKDDKDKDKKKDKDRGRNGNDDEDEFEDEFDLEGMIPGRF